MKMREGRLLSKPQRSELQHGFPYCSESFCFGDSFVAKLVGVLT